MKPRMVPIQRDEKREMKGVNYFINPDGEAQRARMQQAQQPQYQYQQPQTLYGQTATNQWYGTTGTATNMAIGPIYRYDYASGTYIREY